MFVLLRLDTKEELTNCMPEKKLIDTHSRVPTSQIKMENSTKARERTVWCRMRYVTDACKFIGLFMRAGLDGSLCFPFLSSSFPAPLLCEVGPPSRCEEEWLASWFWSGGAWIKVVTEQRGGWQMPRPECFSIRLPFQATAKVKHFTGRWRKKDRQPHGHMHIAYMQTHMCVAPL